LGCSCGTRCWVTPWNETDMVFSYSLVGKTDKQIYNYNLGSIPYERNKLGLMMEVNEEMET
jgi:hypothetical protein